jgi:hypothetical protein
MDALGFCLENFDAIGGWRTSDGNRPVDANGALPNGKKFSGPLGLRSVLLERRKDFFRCIAEKMLTFALGRGIEPSDDSAVRSVVQRMEQNGFRFSSLVEGVALSEPFRMRRIMGSNQ